jgi:hypothetical protein
MKQLIIITSMLLSIAVNAQEVDYHMYSPTASGWDIVEYSLYDTSGTKYLLKEYIDTKGRVTELQFLKDGLLIDDPLCYLANRVTFEYSENRIIETLYHGEQTLIATDCEMYFQTTYHLGNEGYIIETESLAKYDFNGLEKNEIEKWKEWVPELKIVKDTTGLNLQVEYYYHSRAKMNGVYPVNRNYVLVEDGYYGDEPERISILKGLNKRKN